MRLFAIILGSLAAVVALAIAPSEPPDDDPQLNITDWAEPQWRATYCSPHNHESFNSSNPDLAKVIAKWNDICQNKHIHIWPRTWIYFKSGNVMVWICNNYWANNIFPCQGNSIEKILAEINRSCDSQHGGWVDLERWSWDTLKKTYYSVGRDPFTYTDGNRIQECGLGTDGLDADTCGANHNGDWICPH